MWRMARPMDWLTDFIHMLSHRRRPAAVVIVLEDVVGVGVLVVVAVVDTAFTELLASLVFTPQVMLAAQ